MIDLKVTGTVGIRNVSSTLEGLENALVASRDNDDFMVSAIGKFDDEDPVLIIRAVATYLKDRMCQDFSRNANVIFTEALCDTIIDVTNGIIDVYDKEEERDG